jgi:hypothetical protein
MNLNNIRLAHSKLSDNVYVGYLSKDGKTWQKKKDITSDFLGAVIDRFSGYVEKISCNDGSKYEITVKKIS